MIRKNIIWLVSIIAGVAAVMVPASAFYPGYEAEVSTGSSINPYSAQSESYLDSLQGTAPTTAEYRDSFQRTTTTATPITATPTTAPTTQVVTSSSAEVSVRSRQAIQESQVEEEPRAAVVEQVDESARDSEMERFRAQAERSIEQLAKPSLTNLSLTTETDTGPFGVNISFKCTDNATLSVPGVADRQVSCFGTSITNSAHISYGPATPSSQSICIEDSVGRTCRSVAQSSIDQLLG